ncbi:unnamed protein product, partial [Heterosigma akashiwo]
MLKIRPSFNLGKSWLSSAQALDLKSLPIIRIGFFTKPICNIFWAWGLCFLSIILNHHVSVSNTWNTCYSSLLSKQGHFSHGSTPSLLLFLYILEQAMDPFCVRITLQHMLELKTYYCEDFVLIQDLN